GLGDVMLANFSLGDGVALYSDRPVTVTTPDTMKVTVGSDSRTALGTTYAEVYDVDDDTINAIRDGRITSTGSIANKTLISATLTRRALNIPGAAVSGLAPLWRTTKFDQTRSLSYSITDSGSFSFSSAYTFGMGMKFNNGVSASFDASAGVSG